MAHKDKEKSELFRQLLKEKMKNRETESSIISDLCDNIENENKAIIKTNEDIDQLGIVVRTNDFVEILKESR